MMMSAAGGNLVALGDGAKQNILSAAAGMNELGAIKG